MNSDINVKRFVDEKSGLRMVAISGALAPPEGSWLDQFKRGRDEFNKVNEMAEAAFLESDGPAQRRKKLQDAQKKFTKIKRREQLKLALEDCKEIRAAFCPPSSSKAKGWQEVAGWKVTMNLHKRLRQNGHPWMFYELLFVEPRNEG